jgi:protein-arginine kinase activator protein McsA
LENAIQEENYEEAAQLRDELQQAEQAGDEVKE